MRGHVIFSLQQFRFSFPSFEEREAACGHLKRLEEHFASLPCVVRSE